MKKRISKLLAGMLLLCLALSNFSVVARANVNEVVTESFEEENNLVSGARSVVETDVLRVVYTLNSIWESGYSLGVEVMNISEETVSEWAARLPIKEEIASIWGVELTNQDEESISIKHPSWSTDILPNESVIFGMNCNGSLEKMPSTFTLVKGYDVSVEEIISNTMTFKADYLSNGEFYRYSVYNFSNEAAITTSDAIVRLYAGNSLLDTYIVPTTSRTGNVWQVFKISKNGVTELNVIKSISGSSNVE